MEKISRINYLKMILIMKATNNLIIRIMNYSIGYFYSNIFNLLEFTI